MNRVLLILFFIILFSLTGVVNAQYSAYPLQPVPFTKVKFTDAFWYPKIETISKVTLPFAFSQTKERYLNFKEAGELIDETVIAFDGSTQKGNDGKPNSTYPFDDSDMYKLIEAASYSLKHHKDEELDNYLDKFISYIAKAQEEDGYLYTFRTIGEKYKTPMLPWIGKERWQLDYDSSHELYNLGHLIEAGVAHYEATEKRTLLDIAIKAADLIYKNFGWGKIERYTGHQEIEKALIRLSLCVNDKRYLELAKFFLDVRGGGPEYCQAHKPVIQQTTAVGHSVRAMYMYIAMADIAVLTKEQSYHFSIDQIWKEIIKKKI